MTEGYSPEQVVLRLIRVINGEVPRHVAEDYLDPHVRIHMDRAQHKGIATWYKWIHLIRHWGRLANLRMIPQAIGSDPATPSMVLLSMRWTGIDRSSKQSVVTPHTYRLRYLVRNGHVVEIWTHKINYDVIFGPWIKWSIGYRSLLGSAIVYFVLLSLRGIDYRFD